MVVWSCWILAGTGTRCRIRRSRASQTCSMGDVRWICWPYKNWDVFSFQELCTDPCNMGSCIIMLQHEVMVVDEWHNNGPQDLVMLSVHSKCHHKMHLCSLSTGALLVGGKGWQSAYAPEVWRACDRLSIGSTWTFHSSSEHIAGMRDTSPKWRCWMWRSWVGVVTRGLRLWGRLDVLPNSLKRLWRRLMVDKWTFN